MGNRLDGFDINLEFDEDGNVSKVSYECGDGGGCGKELEFSPSSSLDSVVAYHLQHYRDSHAMYPFKRCPFVVNTIEGGDLRCVNGIHDEEIAHTFNL